MRFAAATLLWLIATVALAVAIPSGWLQRNVIDVDGYTALAERAAADPVIQSAVAAQLSTQATALINQRGASVDSSLVDGVAGGYTASASFVRQFGEVNRIAHRWLFADPDPASGTFQIDLAPMLRDGGFRVFLDAVNVQVPDTVEVPVTVLPDRVQPGRLHQLQIWGPWVSLGAAALTLVAGVLTVAAARRRGVALAALGGSALLVGAAGWAGVALARGALHRALDVTTGDVRRVADALAGDAIGGVHQWLNLTLAAGGALVVFGVFIAVLDRLRRA